MGSQTCYVEQLQLIQKGVFGRGAEMVQSEE